MSITTRRKRQRPKDWTRQGVAPFTYQIPLRDRYCFMVVSAVGVVCALGVAVFPAAWFSVPWLALYAALVCAFILATHKAWPDTPARELQTYDARVLEAFSRYRAAHAHRLVSTCTPAAPSPAHPDASR